MNSMFAPGNTVKCDRVKFTFCFSVVLIALLGQTMIDRRVKQLNFNRFCMKTTLID